MANVSEATSLLGRARDAGRRLTGAAELPVTGAVLLGILAVIQVTRGAVSGPTEPVFRGQPGVVSDGPPTVALLLALLATAPVALLRTRLVFAAVTVTLANSLTLAGGYVPTVAATIAMVLVGYLVSRHRSHRVWLLLLLPFGVLLAFPLGAAADVDDSIIVVMLLATAVAGIVGSTVRSRAEAAARRASDEYVAGSLLELAARGERARIARELHDVVAHNISMISVQAETARLTTPGMPAAGAKRLSAIGDTAREALSEMRRLLGVLREDADALPTRAPQPGLADLVDLVDGARATAGGASTRLIVHGQVTPLEPGVELTAYRIVQEALTNSRRHAPGAAVDVELDYGEAALHVRVRDNGPGLAPRDDAVDGHGLLGMRERAAMVGGVMRVVSGSKGGFLVEGKLPVERAGKS
jgi:signal transduction histidine kinase